MSKTVVRFAKGWHEVSDPAALAELVRNALSKPFRGVVLAAARSLAGVALGKAPRPGQEKRRVWAVQRLLSQILQGRRPRLTEDSVWVLQRLIPPDRHEELRAVLLSADARRRLARYMRWLSRKTLPKITRSSRRQFTNAVLCQMLQGTLRRRFPSDFTRFQSWARARGHRDARIELSLRRIAEPLVEFETSGGVERGWSELTAGELRRFVVAGIRRERIMLSRWPELQRVQQTIHAVATGGIKYLDLG
jgi:hypothetical protein